MRAIPVLLALALAGPASAASYYVSPDVPAVLGGATVPPWEAAHNVNGTYATAWGLTPGASIDALERVAAGDWYFSIVAAATLPDGATYDPRDVVRSDGAVFAKLLDGASSGIPPGSNVDALFLPGGDPTTIVVSFDVPTTIQGTTFEPADLARYRDGQWDLWFDASAANPPIPTSTNVTGADEDPGGALVLTFDVPTTLGSTTYLPGDLVRYLGASFSLAYSDPAWPAGARADAVAFVAPAGRVPPTIVVDKTATPGRLRISWQASCSWGASDYGIYEGLLGAWASHRAIDCSDDGGDRTEEIATDADDHYYLVVPSNGDAEGSYGSDWAGAERPPGVPACLPTQQLSSCP